MDCLPDLKLSVTSRRLGITFSGATDTSMIQVKLGNNALEWPKSQENFSSGDQVLCSWIGEKGLTKGRYSLVIKSLYPIVNTEFSLKQKFESVGNCEH